MKLINDSQKQVLLQYLTDFKNTPALINEGEEQDYHKLDTARINALPHLQELIKQFIDSSITLEDFKLQSEKQCRQYPYWGFKGFSGQMQLNQYVNNITDTGKEQILRQVMVPPKDIKDAVWKLDSLEAYLRGLKDKADNPKSIPRLSQSFMLSYFWEIQTNVKWITYYGSAKKVLVNLGFELDSQESYSKEYILFLDIMNEIKVLFDNTDKITDQYPLWYVEHVLWCQYMKMNNSTEEPHKIEVKTVASSTKQIKTKVSSSDWLPPIVSDLERLAKNQETEWSKANGVRPEKAFETKLRYAFTLLGYQATELGQGKGRMPDGYAVSTNLNGDDYAIIYDAKAREDLFKVGTSDREIQEYIIKTREELRSQRIHKFYFVIISSAFDENIAVLKDVQKRTQIPVTLLTAKDLLFILENKMQDIDISHSRIEDIFLDTGLITRERIIEVLGLR